MAPRIRLAVIDGTGPRGQLYDQRMGASFCRQLGRSLGDAAFYQRGPELLGNEVLSEADAARRWLKAQYAGDPEARLMLAGYSRGGSAAIMAAEMLERDGIEVDSLFLFDAVARHRFHRGHVIPANVRFSRHARRCQNLDFVEKYEGTLTRLRGLGGVENPIRPLFGNTGLTWRGRGDHQPAEVFVGSHGAMGGVGWKVVVEDNACEHQVADWMNGHLAERGVDIALIPIAPIAASPETAPWAFEKWLMDNIYHFTLHAIDRDMPVLTGGGVAYGDADDASESLHRAL